MSGTTVPAPTYSSLLAELHQHTRSEHAILNKTIVARLPLCLPPYATNPYFYAAGLEVYSQIYIALENAWSNLLQQDNTDAECLRAHNILASLRTHNLARTQRIQSDLRNLKQLLGSHGAGNLETLHEQTLHIQDTISHIIAAKPHLILAYTWPMYLALFNGGRWIASQLSNAGPQFWHTDADINANNSIEDQYLSFWFFDDSVRDGHHGETVKIGFRQRFHAISEELEPIEREEIVQETKRVFTMCADLIAVLDQHAAQAASLTQQPPCNALDHAGDEPAAWVNRWMPMQRIWNGLRSAIGFSAGPTPLRNDFEQHA